jgi:hypothetical protein
MASHLVAISTTSVGKNATGPEIEGYDRTTHVPLYTMLLKIKSIKGK